MLFLRYVTLFLTALIIFSCAEEEQFINANDQLYIYHAPQMRNRSVFTYDSTVDTLGRLTDLLGRFDKSQEDVADTLNYMIRREFENEMIYSYRLENSEIVIVYARLELDSVDIKNDKIIITDSLRIPRNDIGNRLLPSVYWDNFNREIVACNDFFLVSGTDIGSGERFFGYVRQSCENLVDRDAVLGFIKTIPNIMVDTISIEQVNYVYVSY